MGLGRWEQRMGQSDGTGAAGTAAGAVRWAGVVATRATAVGVAIPASVVRIRTPEVTDTGMPLTPAATVTALHLIKVGPITQAEPQDTPVCQWRSSLAKYRQRSQGKCRPTSRTNPLLRTRQVIMLAVCPTDSL